MTHRCIRWGFLFSLALLMGFAVCLIWLSNARQVSRARFERVEKGMSWEQVVSNVGGPPRNYSRGVCATLPHGFHYMGYESWLCDDGQLLVRFDGEGKAADVVVCDVISFPPPTFIERVREWLGI
jgi:hypothetical protein